MSWTAPTPPEADGPMTGVERPMLTAYLGFQRRTLRNICAGLTAEQLVLRAVEPSTLSLLGLVRHMAKVERTWLRERFGGESFEPMWDPAFGVDADFEDLDPARAEQDYQRYLTECELADAAIAGVDLDAIIHVRGEDLSLRFVHLHLVNEYARHNGHADLLRQRIDGATDR